MGLRNKNIKLRTFFVQYLLTLLVGFLLIVLIGVGLFFISIKTGSIIPIRDVEANFESKKTKIASAKTVSLDLIPEICKYAVVSKDGEFLSGSMTKSKAVTAKQKEKNETNIGVR